LQLHPTAGGAGQSQLGRVISPEDAPPSEVRRFLLELADALHGASVPTPDIEDRVHAASRALGLSLDAFVLPSAVFLSQGPPALRRMDFESHWNLRRMEALRSLCDALVQGRLDLAGARAELARIMAQPWRFSRAQVVVAYGLYSVAVTARIGGNWREIAAGVLIGLLAGLIHVGAALNRPVDLLKSFLAALAGGLATYALALVLPPFEFALSLFGGVTLLVPAMLLTIGTWEMADQGVEAGLNRLAYAMLRFLLIGIGLAGAANVAHLFPHVVERVATPLPWPVVTLLVAMGGVVLTICLQGRARDAPWTAAGALLAFGVSAATKAVLGGDGSPLLASLIVGLAGALAYRFWGQALGTVVVPGLLQLAPGFIGTRAVLRLLGGGRSGELATFFQVVTTSLELTIGLMLALVIVRPRVTPSSESAGPVA
jgi:uncharacterized membrane protein YjjP (DUF1212 family)